MKLDSCLWPVAAQPEAVKLLAHEVDIAWFELEPQTLTCSNLAAQLRHAVPALLTLDGLGLLALQSVRRNTALCIAPDGSPVRMPIQQIADLVTAPLAALHEREIGAMLDACAISGRQRERALRALIAERIADTPAAKVLQLRTHPGSSFTGQLNRAGLLKRLTGFALGHLADYALTLVAWTVIGSAALGGHVDSGGLTAWALLLALIVPIRLWVSWSQGVLAVGAGGLLKQRLLAGALNLDADALHAEGAGRMLARTLEAEAMESLSLSGGLAALLSILELSVAAVVLSLGAGGWMHLVLLTVWVALILAIAWRFVLSRLRWTDSRLVMTHDLVERMTGHRTRLTQEPPHEWHQGEDDTMATYADHSERMDRLAAILTAAAPRGWVLLAFAVLLPLWIQGDIATTSAAIAIGGILLADQSLRRLTAGLAQLAGAAIAWRQIAPLFHAAEKRLIDPSATPPHGDVILDASHLVFRYREQSPAILNGYSIKVHRGDFLLLEGGSGSGKSTLASLLTGLRKPESGMLLTGGLDLHSLGELAWRKRIAAAPQYHQNHVLSSTFAFNLLMGRKWPPEKADLEEAELLCRELGLGPLLERMPSGLNQMVGETGWQLSQGERSRLFMARAMLQGGSLIVLDECFAALDPETLRQALECVLRRAETLLVIAHP